MLGTPMQKGISPKDMTRGREQKKAVNAQTAEHDKLPDVELKNPQQKMMVYKEDLDAQEHINVHDAEDMGDLKQTEMHYGEAMEDEE